MKDVIQQCTLQAIYMHVSRGYWRAELVIYRKKNKKKKKTVHKVSISYYQIQGFSFSSSSSPSSSSHLIDRCLSITPLLASIPDST